MQRGEQTFVEEGTVVQRGGGWTEWDVSIRPMQWPQLPSVGSES